MNNVRALNLKLYYMNWAYGSWWTLIGGIVILRIFLNNSISYEDLLIFASVSWVIGAIPATLFLEFKTEGVDDSRLIILLDWIYTFSAMWAFPSWTIFLIAYPLNFFTGFLSLELLIVGSGIAGAISGAIYFIWSLVNSN